MSQEDIIYALLAWTALMNTVSLALWIRGRR